MGGVLFPSSSNDQVQVGTTEKPENVMSFQTWVINTKKDNQILGSFGADGKWGKNTSNAWLKYGEEYKKLNPNVKTVSPNSQNFIGSSLWNYVKNQNPFILTSVGNDGNTEQKKQKENEIIIPLREKGIKVSPIRINDSLLMNIKTTF
jgi:hypothetical protein